MRARLSLAASYIPARRATRIAPVTALHGAARDYLEFDSFLEHEANTELMEFLSQAGGSR